MVTSSSRNEMLGDPERSALAAREAMASKSFHPYPWYSPRFWHGMRFGDWMKLVIEHRFRIHPARIPMAVLLSGITPINSLLAACQSLIHGKRVASTHVVEPPVFIIGHWRSGTTLLHELLAVDERFASPNTYECFAPHHCLLTSSLFPLVFGILLPKNRPMDNMAAGWKMPQEDEFALLTLGAPTPYRRMAFPNCQPADSELIDMEGVSCEQLQRWQEAMEYFVKLLTYRYGKRVLLKSPPHTGRIGFLAKLFPGAKFIHIARDPYAIFPSTRRLWYALDAAQACQRPHHRQTDEYIMSCFERMYSAFFQQREELAPDQIGYVRYEDLVADPVSQIERLYDELQLGDFEVVSSIIREQAKARAGYRPNRHELPEDLRRQINQRWADYFDAFGYTVQE